MYGVPMAWLAEASTSAQKQVSARLNTAKQRRVFIGFDSVDGHVCGEGRLVSHPRQLALRMELRAVADGPFRRGDARQLRSHWVKQPAGYVERKESSRRIMSKLGDNRWQMKPDQPLIASSERRS